MTAEAKDRTQAESRPWSRSIERAATVEDDRLGIRDDRRRLGGQLGRYRLLERLGVGGMAEVYAAYEPETGRRVALKVPDTRDHNAEGRKTRQRLYREAAAMAQIGHQNVASVFGIEHADGEVFMVMELVDGEDLEDWLLRSPRAWREVVRKFIEAAHGLAAVHAAGLVHRDFKPDNVLLGRDGSVRLADFGLAIPTGAPAGNTGTSWRLHAATPSLTQTGMVLGTPAYMAPEQAEGQPTDARTDQFSFCVALWHGLYGERPFVGENLSELRHNAVRGCIQAPAPESVASPRLHQALLRGLQPIPGDRWPSMSALIVELETVLAENERSRPPRVHLGSARRPKAVAAVTQPIARRSRRRACPSLPAPDARAEWPRVDRRPQCAGLR